MMKRGLSGRSSRCAGSPFCGTTSTGTSPPASNCSTCVIWSGSSAPCRVVRPSVISTMTCAGDPAPAARVSATMAERSVAAPLRSRTASSPLAKRSSSCEPSAKTRLRTSASTPRSRTMSALRRSAAARYSATAGASPWTRLSETSSSTSIRALVSSGTVCRNWVRPSHSRAIIPTTIPRSSSDSTSTEARWLRETPVSRSSPRRSSGASQNSSPARIRPRMVRLMPLPPVLGRCPGLADGGTARRGAADTALRAPQWRAAP